MEEVESGSLLKVLKRPALADRKRSCVKKDEEGKAFRTRVTFGYQENLLLRLDSQWRPPLAQPQTPAADNFGGARSGRRPLLARRRAAESFVTSHGAHCGEGRRRYVCCPCSLR